MSLAIPYIKCAGIEAEQVTVLFDKNGITSQQIAIANWKEDFPYTPNVHFRIAHNDESILIEYTVEETHVRAMASEDNGHVWEDSCVEMFVAFDDSHYYNVECNCRGRVLLACGPDRNNRTYALPGQVSLIKRAPSIQAPDTFDSIEAPKTWSMQLVIPAKAFFTDNIKTLCGRNARANFYKCGDKLPVPHFLSWQPIAKLAPDFHLPEFFGDVKFE
jgi:hypothetical protein